MFPSDNIPNSEKNKEWLRKYGVALNQFHVQNWSSQNFPRSLHQELIAYRNGVQSQARYKRGINKLVNNNGRTDIGTNQRNLKLLDRYMTAVNGKLNKLELDARVKQIDAFANEYKNLYDANIRTAMLLRQNKIEYKGILEKTQLNPDELPLNEDERKLLLMRYPQIDEEMEMEVALNGVLTQNEIDIIRNDVRLDWLVLGIGGVRIEKKNGRTFIRRLDPTCSGTSICTRPDFSDMRFAYEIIAMTPDEIRMQAQGQLTDAEFRKVEGAAGVPVGATTPYYPLQGQAMNQNIAGQRYNFVIDFEVISVCDEDVEVKVKPDGTPATYFQENGRNRTTDRPDLFLSKSKVQRVYTCKYVIGADVVWDAHEKYDETRSPVAGQKDVYNSPLGPISYTDKMYEMDEELVDPARCLMGFKFYQPGLAYGASVSTAERMLPHLDVLELTWRQIINTQVTYVGRGISIDLDQIVGIKTGTKTWSEAEIISLLLEKNISLFRGSVSAKYHNARGGGGAVEFKDDPADIKMQNLLNTFVQQLNILKEISGLSSLDTGGTPASEVGLGVSQLASMGTDNMLDNIQFADKKMFEAISKHLLYDIQAFGGAGSYKGKPFKIDPAKHSSNIYNLTVEAAPSKEEWAALMAEVGQFARETQDRTILIDVRRAATLIQAELIFAAKQYRLKVEAQQKEAANQEATFTAQSETAKASGEAAIALQAQQDNSKMLQMTTQGQIDLTSKVVVEGLKLGKSPEEIAKLVAVAQLTLPTVQMGPQEPEMQQVA